MSEANIEKASIIKAFRRYLLDNPEKADEVASAVIQHIIDKGDAKMLKELLDRIEGPVAQKIEINDTRIIKAVAIVVSTRYNPEEVDPFMDMLDATLRSQTGYSLSDLGDSQQDALKG